jgi:hypothetical protein
MRKLQFNLARPTLAQPRSARMATMGMPLTHARPTATTDLIILPGEYLLGPVLGSMGSTVVAASTTDGAGTMAVAGTVTMTDSVAKPDGVAEVNSTGTKASTGAEVFMVVEGSREAASAVVTGFMAEAGSMAAGVEASTVAAGPTGEATGSYCRIIVSHLNGWQLK